MRKQLFFLQILLLLSAFVAAQEMPGSGIPVKYGKYLLYCDWNSDKDANSTVLNFTLYNSNLNKEAEYSATVENFAGKFCNITYVYDFVPGAEWIEVSMRLKALSASGIIIRLDHDFKIIGRYNFSEETNALNINVDKISLGPIDNLPQNHNVINSLIPNGNTSNGDVRTQDGSLFYLNHDVIYNVSNPSYSSDNVKLGKVIQPTSLCFFKSEEKNYELKWKQPINDKYVRAYKIYLFGNDLFLYTSSFVENQEHNVTEQKIRKVDINTGNIIYEAKLQSKDNYELMLSNVTYNNQSGNLVMCGNYITTLLEKEQKKTTDRLSSFFIGRIDVNGNYISKEIAFTSEPPAGLKQNIFTTPFLCVKQLVLNSDGEYTAVGQLNYQFPDSYWANQNPGGQYQDYRTSFRFLPVGLSVINFTADLEVTTQENNMISFRNNDPVFVSFGSYIPETIILGSNLEDKLYCGVCSTYDSLTETIVITQVYNCPKLDAMDASVYSLKVKAGKTEYFEVKAEVVSKDTFETFLLDTDSFIYYVAKANKYLYSKVEI